LETEKGIIIRFVIGHRYFSLTCQEFACDICLLHNGNLDKCTGLNFVVVSATPGGVLDRAIDAEDDQHKDFLRLVW
jgi:hypothetical protein